MLKRNSFIIKRDVKMHMTSDAYDRLQTFKLKKGDILSFDWDMEKLFLWKKDKSGELMYWKIPAIESIDLGIINIYQRNSVKVVQNILEKYGGKLC